MHTQNENTPIRLAAIDLDGTLLGPDSTISPENLVAVDRLSREGIEVVFASGRHFKSMIPYLLPQVKWVVSSQGAEVGTFDQSVTLRCNFLHQDDLGKMMAAVFLRPVTPVYYTRDEVFTTKTPNAHLTNYSYLSGRTPVFAEKSSILGMDVQKIIWVGESALISSLREDKSLSDSGLQAFRTEDTIFEIMPWETSKASALASLTDHLGLRPENVAVFGDGENDIPMFDWAGTSFAMAHGRQEAIARAKRVSPAASPDVAFARSVDLLLSEIRS
ncbi:MAG: HAD family phosphatase [Verrucomicrobiaceae bacterium]|nr:MAG: HAD family phosphatase [Verrucomicrobiaceae bacterium]